MLAIRGLGLALLSHAPCVGVIITARRTKLFNALNTEPRCAGPPSVVSAPELPNVKPSIFGNPVYSIAMFQGCRFARFGYLDFQVRQTAVCRDDDVPNTQKRSFEFGSRAASLAHS
jgi:hypothetical protein